MKPRARPAVVAISSQVARGAIGNRSIVHALEAFGYPVWAVPTILLPFHPGHGPSTRIEPDPAQFGPFLDDLLGSKWFAEIGAIITGYMANAVQAGKVAEFVAAAKEKNPDLVYLCDPVIGDAGGLYVKPETAAAIRDLLLPQSDIATPNIHELAWLTNRPGLSDAAGAVAAARILPPATVMVTSTPGFMRGNIGNLLVEPDGASLAEHRLVAGPGNGGGDLLSGLFLALLLEGLRPVEALEKATASIFEVMSRAAQRGSDELMPQADTKSLVQPMSPVTMRRVAMPAATAQ
jgi:pyridoxine kinase